jgi:tight adherence protein B
LSDVFAIALAALVGGGLFGMLMFASALGAIGSGLAAPFVVDRFFVRLHGNRASRIEKQLSEALSLQANVLRAGQSLSRSLRILAEETKAPLKEDLERMLGEVDLGRPLEQALERFAARIPSKDIDMWVTAMLVHRQTGGNLAGVMDGSAKRVAERLQLRSEIKAMTAQGRLSGLVVAIAPLLFFFLLSVGSREQMEFLFTSALGLTILIGGLTMNLVGMLWIRHALRIRL